MLFRVQIGTLRLLVGKYNATLEAIHPVEVSFCLPPSLSLALSVSLSLYRYRYIYFIWGCSLENTTRHWRPSIRLRCPLYSMCIQI